MRGQLSAGFEIHRVPSTSQINKSTPPSISGSRCAGPTGATPNGTGALKFRVVELALPAADSLSCEPVSAISWIRLARRGQAKDVKRMSICETYQPGLRQVSWHDHCNTVRWRVFSRDREESVDSLCKCRLQSAEWSGAATCHILPTRGSQPYASSQGGSDGC
jgi:hypothetical protein